MKLQTALLARYAEVDEQGGLLNVTGAGLNVFGVDRFPCEVPVGIALLVTFDESEADRQHQLGVTVLGPELEQIGQDIDVPFTPILGQYHAEGWRGMYAITGAIELALDKPGAHSVQIMLDGDTAGDIPFLVLDAT